MLQAIHRLAGLRGFVFRSTLGFRVVCFGRGGRARPFGFVDKSADLIFLAGALFALGFLAERDTAVLDEAIETFGYVFVVVDKAGLGVSGSFARTRVVVYGDGGVVV